MKNDEDDLYALALGESYYPQQAQSPETSSPTSLPITSGCQIPPSSDSSSVSAELFRKLLIGSRSQIERLKTENEMLKINLKNAIDSSGVVICPNCTHHFKDRQCSMRPRAMRKMRARNCVEIEFCNLEDLEAWLYLNQLETNNDGMPTVMNVKKAAVWKENSLKTAGSLLPGLIQEKKREKSTRKISNEEKGEETFDNNRTEERHSTKIEEKNDSRSFRKHCSEKRKDNEYEHRKTLNISRSSHSRKSGPPSDSHSKNKLVDNRKEENEKHRKFKEPDAKRPLVIPIKQTTKRNSSITESEERERKIAKKSISERINFPNAEASVDIRIKPNNSEKLIKGKTNTERDTLNFPTRSSSDNLPTADLREKPKRSPIIWCDKVPSKLHDPKGKTVEGNINSIKFEFKIKPVEKKKDVIATIPLQKVITTSNRSKSKPKYQFVATSRKNAANSSSSSETEPASTADTSLKCNETKSESISFTEKSDIKHNSTENKIEWKICSVKKTTAILDHIYKRALERQSFKPSWPPSTIVLDGNVQQTRISKNEKTDIQVGTNILPYSNDVSSNEREDHNKIANTLKQIGVSAEGIALLKKQLEKTSNVNDAEKTLVQAGSSTRDNRADAQPRSRTQCSSREPFYLSGEKNGKARNTVPTPLSTNLSSDNAKKFIEDSSEINGDDEHDILDEFFPGLANVKYNQNSEATPTNTDSSYRPTSAESLGSMSDREEEELTILIREDSVVPPNGDCLLNFQDIESDQTIVSSRDDANVENRELPEGSSVNNDWEQFCLEDVEDDVDETTRERKLSEMEKSDETGMDWEENLEHLDDASEEVCSQTQGQSKLGNSEEITTLKGDKCNSRPVDPHPLEMKSEFRLSDEEDLISPVTSTPRPEQMLDDHDEPLDNLKDEMPRLKDDSFVDELDWNYGTDYEEDDEQKGDIETDNTVIEVKGVGVTNDTDKVGESGLLEDGEISEDEEKEKKIEDKKETKKTSIRERITYVTKESEISSIKDEKDSSRDYNSGSHHRRSHYSSRPHRCSQENRDRTKRDSYIHGSGYNRSDRSLLKRRN